MELWIADLEWDDGNLDELAGHGVARAAVVAVLQENPKFRRNKKGRAATHQMIGPDRGGSFWTICLVRVFDERWRAVTGWPSEDHEIAWYRKS